MDLEKSTQDDKMNQCQDRINEVVQKLNSLNLNSVQKLDKDGVNLMNYMYRESLVYQDIFNAYNSNIFTKKGTATGWDETSYNTNPWNNRRILKIGGGVNSNGNGMLVNVPDGYNVLWIRVLNDRWMTFRVNSVSNEGQVNYNDIPEIYASGFRKLNGISPDGGSPDFYWDLHQWFAIPLRQSGQYMVYSDKNSDDWISGIGFGKNLWNHAYNSAVAYHWALNPHAGNPITWVSENWNNDQLAHFNAGSQSEVSVPVFPSGKDKIIYIIEHNNNWLGTMHGNVFINGQQVERFRTSYGNPFSVHHNSKIYSRYMATRIPANLIQNGDKFVKLKIDMSASNHNLYFREIGTHDYI